MYRVAVTLLRLNEPEICKCEEISDAWSLLKVVPKLITNSEQFIGLCFKHRILGKSGSLSQWVSLKMSGKSIFQNHAHPHISYLFSLPDHRLRRQDSDASVHSVPGATVPPHFQKQVAYITDEK